MSKWSGEYRKEGSSIINVVLIIIGIYVLLSLIALFHANNNYEENVINNVNNDTDEKLNSYSFIRNRFLETQ